MLAREFQQFAADIFHESLHSFLGVVGRHWRQPTPWNSNGTKKPLLHITELKYRVFNSIHEFGRGAQLVASNKAKKKTPTPFRTAFGRHVRSCRRARGLTQEVLAERSGLSADTIRRLEHGDFSPSLDTLRKIACGLELTLTTLFEALEIGERDLSRELRDQLALMTPWELEFFLRLLPFIRELVRSGPRDD